MERETSDRGWRIAMILGGLLCAVTGAGVAGLVDRFSVQTKIQTIDSVLSRRGEIQDRVVLELADATDNQTQTAKEIANLARSIDRLSERICYLQYGKPCPYGSENGGR